MVKIRLVPNKKSDDRFFRIVAISSEKKRSGEYLENLGWYDPKMPNTPKFLLKMERLEYWLSVGAQPTERVKKFIEITKTGNHQDIQKKKDRAPSKK